MVATAAAEGSDGSGSLSWDVQPWALEAACSRGDLSTARSLLDQRADACAAEASGKATLLHLAASRGSAQMVSLLLDRHAEIDAVSADGLQAVHVAARVGALAALAELWRHDGTVICRGDREGTAPAHHAAQSGRIHVLEWLYLRGVPMNSQDSFGFSPLHYAVHGRRPLAAQLLVNCGAGALSPDMKGRTPLHWAALQGCSGLVDAAIKIRADALGGLPACSSRDERGKTPCQLSRCRCSDPCMSVQLAHLEAWLQSQKKPPSCLRSGCQRARPCHPCLAFCALLLPLLQVLNAALLLLVSLPKLQSKVTMGPEYAFMATGQLLAQLFSLRFWAVASFSDPGYCAPALRLDSDEPGPDGHERLVTAVQAELNDLLRRRFKLLAGPGPPRGDPVAITDAAVGQAVAEVDAGISVGKLRLAEALRLAGAARLGCYPSDYAALASAPGMEADPNDWGKRACAVCGRTRQGRSKHCRECGRCVARFDHHCPWLGNCVGAGNMVPFVKFLAWTFVAVSLAQLLTWQLLEDIPAPLQEWSPWWRLCVKANFAANVVWTVFAGSLLVRQVGLAMVDSTEYEVDQRGGLVALLRATSWSQALGNLAVLLEEPGESSGHGAKAVADLELGGASPT